MGSISITWLLGIFLFVIGIEIIVSHVVTLHRSRFARIGLGIAILILSLISIIFLLITSIIVISLFGIALLFSGASRIIHGINDRMNTNWKRTFSIAVGIFSIILASMILIFPVFGIAFAGLLIEITLLVTGAQIITSGVIGKYRTDNLEDLR